MFSPQQGKAGPSPSSGQLGSEHLCNYQPLQINHLCSESCDGKRAGAAKGMNLRAHSLNRERDWDGKVGRKEKHGGGTAGSVWIDRAVRGLADRGDAAKKRHKIICNDPSYPHNTITCPPQPG